MAYDLGLAQLLRDDLVDEPVTEKKMFGGLAFLRHGHMVCGIHKGGAMFRVGKQCYAEALKINGVTPMMMGEKPMAAMVDISDEACQDEILRGRVMGLALATVRGLPAKVAKPRKG